METGGKSQHKSMECSVEASNVQWTTLGKMMLNLGTTELCFFSDVGCYLFPGTYARLTFRLRAHNFSLRGSLGVARLPTQPTRMRFYAIFD